MRLEEASRLKPGDVVEFSGDGNAPGYRRPCRAIVVRLVRADGDKVKVRVIDVRAGLTSGSAWIGEAAFASEFGEVIKEVSAARIKSQQAHPGLRP